MPGADFGMDLVGNDEAGIFVFLSDARLAFFIWASSGSEPWRSFQDGQVHPPRWRSSSWGRLRPSSVSFYQDLQIADRTLNVSQRIPHWHPTK
jgi:hypothetical protein